MPNHVHMLFQVNPNTTARNEVSSYITSQNRVSGYIVTEILQNLKKYSSKESNKILKRTGQFWHHESYDHVVRSEIEFERIVNYIAQNPVKAHLVNNWKEWKWSYCKPDFISFIND
jgi:REP element-mobilizing transposase RayT